MVFCYILSNFRICTILIEALTPLDRTSGIKMYKNNARSSLICRIAKRSIKRRVDHSKFHAIHVKLSGHKNVTKLVLWHTLDEKSL